MVLVDGVAAAAAVHGGEILCRKHAQVHVRGEGGGQQCLHGLPRPWVNDCPKHGSPLGGGGCVAGFLHRFWFQPLHANPLCLVNYLLSSVHLFHKQAGDYIQRRYTIVIRSTMGSIDLYLVSNFDWDLEGLVGVATPQKHADVAIPVAMEGFRTIEAEQSSISKDKSPNIHHIHKIPDLNVQDLGGMTKIIPDVDTDAYYWLLTDGDVSMTDIWRTAPEAQWDQFLAEEMTTPRAMRQQPAVVSKTTVVGPSQG